MTTLDTLSILQYSVQKSYGQVMAPLFADDAFISSFDIVAIQEPWRNTYQNTTHHPRKDLFALAYLDHPQTRVCFFISKRLKPGSWSIIFHSPDLVTPCLKTSCGPAINFHNVYNPVAHTGENQLPLLENALAANLEQKHLVVGDVNLHHPSWGGPHIRANNGSEDLLILSKAYDLSLLLPPGTITYEEGPGKSTIDLKYLTDFLSNSVIKCDVSDIDHHSDHLPIETHFQISLAASIPDDPRKNWKKINPEIFFKAVIKCIQDSPFLSPPPPGNFDCSTEGLDSQIQSLANGLSKALNESTPDLKICARSKAGFNEECKEA